MQAAVADQVEGSRQVAVEEEGLLPRQCQCARDGDHGDGDRGDGDHGENRGDGDRGDGVLDRVPYRLWRLQIQLDGAFRGLLPKRARVL